MRIRWKLLIAMLAMILVPILVLRWNARSGMQEIGDELAAAARNALIQKARDELQIIVEEHAIVLQRERELIEMILQFQATKLEKWLAGNNVASFETNPDERPDLIQPADASTPLKRFKLMGDGSRRSFDVYYDRVSYLTAAMEHAHAAKASTALAPIYSQLAVAHPDLVFWQMTVFENGMRTVYPGVRHLPIRFKPERTDWYRAARKKDGIFWGRPAPDPFTKRSKLTVATRFRNPAGKLAGVTAIAVPVGELLQNERHFDFVSRQLKVLLVEINTGKSTGRKGIRVVATPRSTAESMRRWWQYRTDEWIDFDDDRILNKIANDLGSRRSNVLDVMHDGVDSLLAYSDIGALGTALMLIVPKDDIMTEALAMEDRVLERIDRQIRFTGFILAAVLMVVVGLAFLLSRSITGNIGKLVDASRRIANGDFGTRAAIRSNDEMGELGRTFDRMVPALEENMKIKQSLDLAMEVQQSLLPAATPYVEGLDIAAASIYCDETGGDFYDFPRVGCDAGQRFGFVVGDVAGHGLSAALLMASARAFLRCRVRQPGQLSEKIGDVNALLASDTNDTGQFVTLFYAEIDTIRRKIQWIRAGHDPALLYDPASGSFEELTGQGAALGVDGKFKFSVYGKEDLETGQILCIGTDGIWETHNPQGEMFGRRRMRDIIRQRSHLPAKEIMTAIIEAVKEFRLGSRQDDDITLVIIKLTPLARDA
ncbi:Serine phosphatase RsbU, regulator of sigma subunit [Olavius algarvensis Delta 1 endosymbiont]|nr:Serine phosphatase RsbU, regulator of sigma subunit [Olavius algarvensis Delta 1 endosymbiont]